MVKKILSKNPFWFLGAGILSAVLHNIFYAIFGFEEAFFFTLVPIFVIFFFASAIYRVVKYFKK